MKIPTDDIDVFVLRSLLALKLVSKKDVADFYKRLATQQKQAEEAKQLRLSEKQPYYGA